MGDIFQMILLATDIHDPLYSICPSKASHSSTSFSPNPDLAKLTQKETSSMGNGFERRSEGADEASGIVEEMLVSVSWGSIVFEGRVEATKFRKMAGIFIKKYLKQDNL